jgi:ATP-dependent Clp protease ATP-binding subunit ClpC
MLKEGTDPQFGARPMRRAVERLLVAPLSRLIASNQVKAGDVVSVHMKKGEPEFIRESGPHPKDPEHKKLVR